ncbi:dephospho-CoA kinase [Halobacillus sp. Marseille-Q1614]|uniref:dephospho-CoA kinase n=1 Tax=Halobacillus sp. Marseille-Q1614 TaxID=2709134 RepID=UPI0015708892|nr:dephospho-CoA kinase [Halobacillus sp. Marseille-Q1614]
MGIVIGLTGSIATGKSTVSQMFKHFEIPVVDADIISREVVNPGEPAYKEIVEQFSEEILNEDGAINRKELGKVIFRDKEKRNILNRIVHPQVRKEMKRQRDGYLARGDKAVVLDIPLLFESKLTDYVDRTLVVYVDSETQLKRLMARDESKEAEAMERIRSQIPASKKAEWADAVIDNSGTREQSFEQLKAILTNWGVIEEDDKA